MVNSSEKTIEKLRMLNDHLLKIISECVRCDNRLKTVKEGDEIEFVPGIRVDCCSLSGLLRNSIKIATEDMVREENKKDIGENQKIYNLARFHTMSDLSWRIMDFLGKSKYLCCSEEKIHEICSCLSLLDELSRERPK